MKLSEASVNSIFVDNDTKLNGTPIEWVVAAQNVDGQGITTLMKKDLINGMIYDAKEPQNPNTVIQRTGNGDYETSNILQWLNSDGSAGHWYTAQHQYDQAPNSSEVGGSYANDAGFLNGFSTTLKGSMQTVEKMGVSKKVHIPSYKEIIGTDSLVEQSVAMNADSGEVYQGFEYRIYRNTISHIYPGYCPSMFIRGAVKSAYAETQASSVLTLIYNTYNSSYSSHSAGWRTNDINAICYGNPDYYYTCPVIYVNSNLPVKFVNGKYQADYKIEPQYSDYGNHKDGFNFKVKISCSESGTSNVTAYADGVEIKTFTVSQYNEYVTLPFLDSDLEDLTEDVHTIRLVAEKGNSISETSFTYTKVSESVPSIFADDIGNITTPFTLNYQVYDDDGDDVDVTIKIDNTVLYTQTNVEQNVNLEYTISNDDYNSLAYGTHTLSIIASDGQNTSTSTISVTKNSMPTISLNTHDMGEVLTPFSVVVTADSEDGNNITIKAYIDNREIQA